MTKLWENTLAYRVARRYVDLCTRMSYSRLEVAGREKIPTDGAVILAPNHCNTLMDALVVLQANKGVTTFGARADMFRKPRMAAILNWLKIVPLARSRDGRAAIAENLNVFDRVVEVLKHGIPFCMFVEGTHRTKRSLLPIKKGVFKLASRAKENLGKPVYIVPVGLEYGDYFEYMSTAKMTYGEPILYDETANVADLSQTLHDRIASLITYFPDDENYEKNFAEYKKSHEPHFKWWMLPAAIISLPFFVALAAICSPLLIITALIKSRLKDPAWYNTVRFGVRLLFTPIVWVFHSSFYILLNFYNRLARTIRK